MNPDFQHALTPLETGITVIAASAGTGKTFTLAALVVRLIAEEGIPIQSLLLTTYTVAATAELRERIRARLITTLETIESGEPPKDEFLVQLLPRLPAIATERLQAAIRDFDEASIHTIHGFCQRALREQAFETGAPFEVEVVADASALYREITEDYWRQHVYPAEPLVAASLSFSELSPTELLRPLREAGGRSGLRVIPAAAERDAAIAELYAALNDFRSQWPAWRAEVTRLLVDGNTWGNKEYKAENLAVKLALLEAAADPDAGCVALLEACSAFCHLTPKLIWDGTNKRKCKVPVEHPLFDVCERFSAARTRLYETTLAHFLAWSRDMLAQRKAERGILLFDDLLTRLHEALTGGDGASVVATLGGRYAAVLVDEFQDTDPTQAAIFLTLFGTDRHRLFLIGDPKQAIYGFRGADLFAYLDAVGRSTRHFTLRQNQRSAKAMVAAVNTLFERPTEPFLDPRIPFDPVGAAGRTDAKPLRVAGQTGAPFHFWFWKDQTRLGAAKVKQELPWMIAAEVTRLLGSDATIGDKKIEPGDCAVLCTDNNQARAVAAALADQGIPAVVLSNANVFASSEAEDLRLILTALAAPSREGLLRSALTTPALGYTMAELLTIDDESIEWEAVRQRWQAHHERWRNQSFIRMFREFLRIEGVRARLIAYPNGERRLTNFQHLAELLHAAAESQHLGPTGLLHWLDEQMKPGAAREETELRLDRDDSAVRVITVHKSKGLEYPVVFCPFLWTHAGLHKNSALLFHDALGELVYDLREEPDAEHTSRAQNEALAEDVRLLYVALTRAKHECHVVWGPFGNGNKKPKDPEVCALMRLLEPPSGAPTFERLAEHATLRSSTDLEDTVRKLCADAPDQFTMHELPVEPIARQPRSEAPLPLLKARTFTREIDATWRSTSYSALNAIHPLALGDDAPERRIVDLALLHGIHSFPRGTKAGACLHDLLEHVDFAADPDRLRELITRKLQQHAMFSEGYVAAVEEMLAEIRAVFPSAALARATSLREVEFHLPAALLSPAELAAFAGGTLSFDKQRGILKGFMDLVFEHEGRFFVIDWKSNWLGETAEAYTAEMMEAEMRRYRYPLQRQLYVFALHRFLQVRIPSYDPAQQLGGAYYVFLRGLDRTRPESGILQTPPDLAALNQLERLFPRP